MTFLSSILRVATRLKSGNQVPTKKQLMGLLGTMNVATEQVIETLSEESLKEGTEIGNPVAKTKYDALTFVFKHQMWHNEQIAMIKRIIG